MLIVEISAKYYLTLLKVNKTKKNGVEYQPMRKIQFRGERMRMLRESLEWTLTDLERELEKRYSESNPEVVKKVSQLSLIETNKREPSMGLAIAISEILETSMDYLCGIIDYDHAINGIDEVVVVVRDGKERELIQAIAYKLLDLDQEDQARVKDLVDRFLAGTGKLTNTQRFNLAVDTLMKLGGQDFAQTFFAQQVKATGD